jgi:dTDP-4-dehydrorhamnose reductase
LRLVVTGREGQVARSLLERACGLGGIEVVAVGRPEMDLTDAGSVRTAILDARPDIVVSAAAYTAVDRAEEEPDLAYAVNAAGAGAVAQAAAAAGAPVIHLSTDYVFSGEADGPYRESDPTGPQSVYGRTKLAGEIAVAAANPRHVILRTAWVYSPFGRNFVKTMLMLAQSRDTVPVVSDQWGSPTSALDIADGILHIAASGPKDGGRFGIFHLAGTGSTNWSGFAASVFDASRKAGGPHAQVKEIATSDYPTKARRPPNSRLATEKLAAAYGWSAPEWQVSCAKVV